MTDLCQHRNASNRGQSDEESGVEAVRRMHSEFRPSFTITKGSKANDLNQLHAQAQRIARKSDALLITVANFEPKPFRNRQGIGRPGKKGKQK